MGVAGTEKKKSCHRSYVAAQYAFFKETFLTLIILKFTVISSLGATPDLNKRMMTCVNGAEVFI